MKIKRSNGEANNTVEYRWHYDWSTCSFGDKLLILVSMFYASHLLFHVVFYSAPLFILLFLDIISNHSFTLILIAYFASYLIYRPHECNNDTLPWYPEWFKKHSAWEWMKFYADWLTIRRGNDELYKNKQFLYCVSPHGILAVNRIQMLGHIWFNEVQPQTFGRYAAATPQFYVPGIRETTIWAAAVAASKKVLSTVIKNGESIYLWVGGTKELMTTDSGSKDTKMVILDRFGFIKLALVHGIDIVPVCQFGEKWIYRLYKFPQWLNSLLYTLTKTPAILFFGKIGLIPYSQRSDGVPIRMGMVVGEPIKVQKIKREDIDFDEHIRPIHEEYMKKMRYLFDTYKHEYHYPDDETLTFVSAK